MTCAGDGPIATPPIDWSTTIRDGWAVAALCLPSAPTAKSPAAKQPASASAPATRLRLTNRLSLTPRDHSPEGAYDGSVRVRLALAALLVVLAPGAGAATIPFRATLTAPTHTPPADNKTKWRYTVRVTDLRGHLIPATVTMQIVDPLGSV